MVSALLTDSDPDIRIRGAKRLGGIPSCEAIDLGMECLKRETSGDAFLAICSALSLLVNSVPDRLVDLAASSIALLKGVLAKFEPVELELARPVSGDLATPSTQVSVPHSHRDGDVSLESKLEVLDHLLMAVDETVERYFQNVSLESDSDVIVLQGVCSLLESIGSRITDPTKEFEIVKGIEEAFFIYNSSGERQIRTSLAATFLTSALKGFYSEFADELRMTQLQGLELGPHAEAVFAGITPQHLHSPKLARMLREFADSKDVAIQSPQHKHEIKQLQYLLDSITPISCIQISHEEAVEILRGNTEEGDASPLEDLLIPGTITLKLGWSNPSCPLEGLELYGRTVKAREGEWLLGDPIHDFAQDRPPALGAVVRTYTDEENSSYAEDLIILVPDGRNANTLIGSQPEPSSVIYLDRNQTRELFESDEQSRMEQFLPDGVTCIDFAWDRGEATLSGYSLNGRILTQERDGLLRCSDSLEPIGWAIKYVDSDRREDPKRVIALLPSGEVSEEYWMRSPGLDMLELLGK